MTSRNLESITTAMIFKIAVFSALFIARVSPQGIPLSCVYRSTATFDLLRVYGTNTCSRQNDLEIFNVTVGFRYISFEGSETLKMRGTAIGFWEPRITPPGPKADVCKTLFKSKCPIKKGEEYFGRVKLQVPGLTLQGWPPEAAIRIEVYEDSHLSQCIKFPIDEWSTTHCSM